MVGKEGTKGNEARDVLVTKVLSSWKRLKSSAHLLLGAGSWDLLTYSSMFVMCRELSVLHALFHLTLKQSSVSYYYCAHCID